MCSNRQQSCSCCCRIRHSARYMSIGSILVFMLTATCCGGDYWLETSTTNYGLWRECIKHTGAFQRECTVRFPQLGEHVLKSQRSLTILSTVSAIASAIIAFVVSNFISTSTMSKPPVPITLASICLVISSIASSIALGLFTYQKYEEVTKEMSRSEFGWTWYIGWIGVGLGFLIALFGLCSRHHYQQSPETVIRHKFTKEVSFADYSVVTVV